MAFISLLSILAFEVFIGSSAGNTFVIERRLTPFIQGSRDTFKIPVSVCNRTVSEGVTWYNSELAKEECGRYNALVSNRGQCYCSCPRENATFVYSGNRWRCQENRKVRDLQGENLELIFIKQYFNHLRVHLAVGTLRKKNRNR